MGILPQIVSSVLWLVCYNVSIKNTGSENKLQYRIPYAVRAEGTRLWNENNQLKKRIDELEEDHIKVDKEIRSLNELRAKRDKTIREMNQEILRLMVEIEELKKRK